MSLTRSLRTAAKAASVRLFHAGQRLGVDVLPRHFYSEVPDIRRLAATTEWRAPFSLVGVRGVDLDEQLAFVRATIPAAMTERLGRDAIYERACAANGEPGFGKIEALFLHAFVATHRPRRIIQIGCGVSTAVCLDAAREAAHAIALTAIDPFPTPYLADLARQGALTLDALPVEAVSPAILHALEPGDLFFVDSTHTLGPAGEVSRLVLEWLPRVPVGVHVHFHDIYLPYDYPTDTLTTALFFPHETALVHAALMGNARLRISTSLSMLHHGRPAELARTLPGYVPRPFRDGLAAGDGDFPSSLYLQVSA